MVRKCHRQAESGLTRKRAIDSIVVVAYRIHDLEGISSVHTSQLALARLSIISKYRFVIFPYTICERLGSKRTNRFIITTVLQKVVNITNHAPLTTSTKK